jgi:hypothetical protein
MGVGLGEQLIGLLFERIDGVDAGWSTQRRFRLSCELDQRAREFDGSPPCRPFVFFQSLTVSKLQSDAALNSAQWRSSPLFEVSESRVFCGVAGGTYGKLPRHLKVVPMAGYGDERIEAVRKQAEEMIGQLALNPDEDAFAREQSKLVFDGLTEAYLAKGDGFFDRTRALTVAAALAFALILADDWAKKVDSEFPPRSP